MRAVTISRPGEPDVLAIVERPDPSPGKGEVVVSIRAAGVNRADVLQRRGRYPAPDDAVADVPGLEFAGDVVEVGAGVRTLRVGDRVMGLAGGGAYAERIVVAEGLCTPLPPHVEWLDAGAFPETFATAGEALFRLAGLQAGETVYVSAAASGVGLAAAQLARTAGARVIVSSRRAAKRDRLRELGFSTVVDPEGDGLDEALLHASAGRGVDVVVDLVGGDRFPHHLRALRERGRLVAVGMLAGVASEVDLGVLLRGRLRVEGTVLRSRPLDERVGLVRWFRDRIVPWLADGRVRPVIDRVYPLGRASEAHSRMESNEAFGKLVLTPDG